MCMYKFCSYRDAYSAKYILAGILYEARKNLLKGNQVKTNKMEEFVFLFYSYFNVHSFQYCVSRKLTSVSLISPLQSTLLICSGLFSFLPFLLFFPLYHYKFL